MDIAGITDVVVIVVLLVSAGVALFRGLIKEILTILGIVGGLAIAFFFGDDFVPMVEGWLGVVPDEDPERLFGVLPYDLLAQILSYAGVCILFVIILNIISHFLSKAVSSSGLGPIDRTLGLIFGILRGVLLLGVLYLPVHLMAPEEKKTEWFEGSNMIFYLETTSAWLAGFLPQSTEKESESARTLLEGMDVLKSEDEEEIAPESDEIKNSYDVDGTEEGYDGNERRGLDRLIDDVNTQPSGGGYNP
ncbi:MAG: CvpA family protein [Bdellovibrionales bacterium]